MFTGIIREVGTIEECAPMGGGVRIRIRAAASAAELETDMSVAVNGICLTVVKKLGSSFELEAVEETLRKTTLGSRAAGDRVNLELPLRMGDRLDGHLVLGHVDAVGRILEIQELESSRLVTVGLPDGFAKYCVPTGSIAIDGISLTIARIEGSSITVSIIPYTLEHTIVREYARSDRVNLEFDVVGKYIERLIPAPLLSPATRGLLTEAYLREMGF
jgi:riboflavin synthase